MFFTSSKWFHTILFAALVLVGVAANSASAAEPRRTSDKPFALETFFVGRTIARGKFESGIAGVKRSLTVKTKGTWNGKTLKFVEDFYYDDGETGRKTWYFTKIAPGLYEGTREDVIGKAVVKQEGDAIKLSYTADIAGKDGSTTRVSFDDTITRIDKRRALNTATVYKYFFPVGTVELTFVKQGR